MITTRDNATLRQVTGFVDNEQLPKKPSRKEIRKLRKLREEINASPNLLRRAVMPAGIDIDTLTLEETWALAWTGGQKILVFLASHSNDPQTLAIAARMENPYLIGNDLIRGLIAENPATSAKTLNYLSTFKEATNCSDIAAHPNTPDEALLRILSYRVEVSGYTEAIISRENIDIDIAIIAAEAAQKLGFDPAPAFKEMLCRELEKPIGLIVSIDAVTQLRARERPDIPALTAWAKKRTEKWDARTIAAFEALQDAEGLDRETLCLAVEELAARKQAPARKGDPREKSDQSGVAQSI